MTNAPDVVYTVTEQHMCLLARLMHHGSLETCLGQARFLQAIAPLVWLGLHTQVTIMAAEPNAAEPPALIEIVQRGPRNERRDNPPAPGREHA